MENKVVLITGSSSGIGAAIAVHLSKIGYKKLALVARRKDRLEEVRKECLENGANYVLILVKDLENLKTAEEVIKETIDHFKSLDIVVSNAGKPYGCPTRLYI